MSIGITHVTDESLNDRDLRAVDGPAEASLGALPAVAADGTPIPGSALSAEELEQLTADIVSALKTVYDPEIPADIYELGLIYKIGASFASSDMRSLSHGGSKVIVTLT
jgi:hypothetical protein